MARGGRLPPPSIFALLENLASPYGDFLTTAPVFAASSKTCVDGQKSLRRVSHDGQVLRMLQLMETPERKLETGAMSASFALSRSHPSRMMGILTTT